MSSSLYISSSSSLSLPLISYSPLPFPLCTACFWFTLHLLSFSSMLLISSVRHAHAALASHDEHELNFEETRRIPPLLPPFPERASALELDGVRQPLPPPKGAQGSPLLKGKRDERCGGERAKEEGWRMSMTRWSHKKNSNFLTDSAFLTVSHHPNPPLNCLRSQSIPVLSI